MHDTRREYEQENRIPAPAAADMPTIVSHETSPATAAAAAD